MTFCAHDIMLFNGSEVKDDCMHMHVLSMHALNMHASPLHKGLEIGLKREKGRGGGGGGRASFSRKDLANVCSRSLRVGEERSMLCIFETSRGGVGR